MKKKLKLKDVFMTEKKIKSNDPMPRITNERIDEFVQTLEDWDSQYRNKALKFVKEVTPSKAYELLHSMRRWYTGQTMAHNLVKDREILRSVMKLEPKDVKGIYRGFKVSVDDSLASLKVGEFIDLDIIRNNGISSWTIKEDITNRFSGGGKGKIGLIVKLKDALDAKPILAPPERTKEWFNAFYEKFIGNSFRPNEAEYVLSGEKVHVEVVRVKK